jgi:hypothetical protein
VGWLAGVYLCVFWPGVLTPIRAAIEWDLFTTGVVLIVVVRWLPKHAPLVAGGCA